MKLGRPPLANKERKAMIVGIRVTHQERRSMEAMAKAQGMKLSEWIRVRLLRVEEARDC